MVNIYAASVGLREQYHNGLQFLGGTPVGSTPSRVILEFFPSFSHAAAQLSWTSASVPGRHQASGGSSFLTELHVLCRETKREQVEPALAVFCKVRSSWDKGAQSKCFSQARQARDRDLPLSSGAVQTDREIEERARHCILALSLHVTCTVVYSLQPSYLFMYSSRSRLL